MEIVISDASCFCCKVLKAIKEKPAEKILYIPIYLPKPQTFQKYLLFRNFPDLLY